MTRSCAPKNIEEHKEEEWIQYERPNKVTLRLAALKKLYDFACFKTQAVLTVDNGRLFLIDQQSSLSVHFEIPTHHRAARSKQEESHVTFSNFKQTTNFVARVCNCHAYIKCRGAAIQPGPGRFSHLRV